MVVNTGVKYPTANANVDISPWNGIAWGDLAYAYDYGANNAYVTAAEFDAGVKTKVAVLKGYGFSIPSRATVVGILMEIRIGCDSNEGAKFGLVGLTKDGSTLAGSNLSDGSEITEGGFTTYTFGGSSNLWGTTWSPSEVNSSNFGALLACEAVDDNADVYLDCIRLTVYYTPEVDISQVLAEVDAQDSAPQVLISQVLAEVDTLGLSPLVVTQVGVEADVTPPPTLYVSQVGIEVDVLETFDTDSRALSGMSGMSGKLV